MIIELNIETRIFLGKLNSRRLRKSGYIPSIIYKKNEKNLNIKIKESKFRSILEIIKNNKYSIYLLLNDFKISVIIKKIQYHPFKNKILHIDFIKN